MPTLLQIIDKLKSQGYETDFSSALRSVEDEKALAAQNLRIERCYRVDEMSDPSEQAIVYVVSSRDLRRRGYIVNSYGVYAEPLSEQLVRDLSG